MASCTTKKTTFHDCLENIGTFELLTSEAKTTNSEDLVNIFKVNNVSLAEVCGLALRGSIAGKQKTLITDASFKASGYASMIEENDERKLLSKRKTFVPVAFGSRVFSLSQLKISKSAKKLSLYPDFQGYS